MNYSTHLSTSRGLLSLSPILAFLLLYVVVSLIIGDFYRMPLSVAFIAASVWSIIIYRGPKLTERIETFSKAAVSPNIIYMIWIFILAGAFSSMAKESGSIDATVSIALNVLPHGLLLPGLFVGACFISLAIGTSVGTVVALVPLAVSIAEGAGGNIPLFVATVLGGAFFGDNLSFISDTTIAATRSQDIDMSAKFKANIRIVLPAAIATLIIYSMLGSDIDGYAGGTDVNAWLVLPYLLIIVLSLMGINVTVVLTSGIAATFVIAIASGHNAIDLATFMGSGVASMGDLIIITMLSAGMLGIIKAMGGINFLLERLSRHIRGPRGAKAVIGIIVSAVNICTANNTVAILTVGSLARKIAERYNISGARTASLLDTCSCIMQCLIPYGAQTLLAASLAGISPEAPWIYLYYPWTLAAAVIAATLIVREK